MSKAIIAVAFYLYYLKMSKKGAELSINTIIIVILAIIVLVVVLLIFSSSMKQIASNITERIRSVFGFWNASQYK